VLARKRVACFGLTPWKKLKIIGGVTVIISFRLTWDGSSSLLPFGFQSEAREASGSEPARLHRAAGRRGHRVAARGRALIWPRTTDLLVASRLAPLPRGFFMPALCWRVVCARRFIICSAAFDGWRYRRPLS